MVGGPIENWVGGCKHTCDRPSHGLLGASFGCEIGRLSKVTFKSE